MRAELPDLLRVLNRRLACLGQRSIGVDVPGTEVGGEGDDVVPFGFAGQGFDDAGIGAIDLGPAVLVREGNLGLIIARLHVGSEVADARQHDVPGLRIGSGELEHAETQCPELGIERINWVLIVQQLDQGPSGVIVRIGDHLAEETADRLR
ncbi:hypothetical protein GCM10009569_27070 [Arthrobacter russicus]